MSGTQEEFNKLVGRSNTELVVGASPHRTIAQLVSGQCVSVLLAGPMLYRFLNILNLPWLVWLSGLSACLQTNGSPVRFLIRAHGWVAGQ